MEKKEKAGMIPPVQFDELTNQLTLALVQIDDQQAEILSLAARVDELERRCSGLK